MYINIPPPFLTLSLLIVLYLGCSMNVSDVFSSNLLSLIEIISISISLRSDSMCCILLNTELILRCSILNLFLFSFTINLILFIHSSNLFVSFEYKLKMFSSKKSSLNGMIFPMNDSAVV